MPRTKLVRKKSSIAKRPKKSTSINGTLVSHSSSSKESSATFVSEEYDSAKHVLREFNIYCDNKVKEYIQGYENAFKIVKQMFSDISNSLPDTLRNLNVNDNVDDTILNSASVEDQNNDPNSAPRTRQSRARKPADGLIDFKKPRTPKVRTSSRSSSRKRSVATPAPPSFDCFKTPMMSSRKLLASGMSIAPKISDRPMCVMRRPVQGEMAISMSGSPLMVGAFSTEDIPTVNVPLQDGRIMSIVPEPGAPPPDIPMFDETTRKYLQTLRAHLEYLAPNSP
uniref:Borealin C-terminal domain-containing protein n=1 Tax=Graphocephala atropunctata TaxID=36148 RepID=A0A1B6MHW9_9HEMI